MENTLRTRLVQLIPALAIALFILSDARPASAEGCFMSLKSCYLSAARARDWSDRWLMGLDCELDWIDCTRRKLFSR